MEPQDRYLLVNGLRLHYLDWGGEGKQTMLLLHGFTALAHAWDIFAPAFCPRYHVLALDQRGHGESQWDSSATYTTEDHLVDIAGFVDALGLEGFVLVGHSMGGRNAIMYTACFPDKVARLVLVDSRPESDTEGSEALRQMLSIISEDFGSIEEVASELKRLYPRLPLEVALHLAHHGIKETPDGKLAPKFDPAMKEQSEQAGYELTDLWLFLEQITCPTLIIRGTESPFLSREMAQRMCQALPSAKLVEIEDAGHLVVQENPVAFEQAMKGFLEG